MNKDLNSRSNNLLERILKPLDGIKNNKRLLELLNEKKDFLEKEVIKGYEEYKTRDKEVETEIDELGMLCREYNSNRQKDSRRKIVNLSRTLLEDEPKSKLEFDIMVYQIENYEECLVKLYFLENEVCVEDNKKFPQKEYDKYILYRKDHINEKIKQVYNEFPNINPKTGMVLIFAKMYREYMSKR